MKKYLIGVLLVIAVAAAAVPYINGLIMEQTLKNLVGETNRLYQETGMGYELEILHYDRGFFSSDLRWRVGFGHLKAVYDIDEVVFTDHAEHGYFGVVSTTSLEGNPWFTRFIDERLNGENPFTIRTSYSFMGDITSNMKMAPFRIEAQEGLVQVREGNLLIETDGNLEDFHAVATWQGFEADDAATVADMRLETTMAMVTPLLWDGDITFSVDQLRAKGDRETIEIDNVVSIYKLQTDMDKDLAHLSVSVNADGLTTGAEVVEKVKGSFSINNMSARGYEHLLRSYTRMASEIIEQLPRSEEPVEGTVTMMQERMGKLTLQLIAALEKLLRKDLEMHIADILVTTGEGDIAADIRLQLKKDMTLMQFAPLVGEPALAVDIFTLDSDVRLPAALIDNPQMLLTPLHPGMQTGIFVQEGENLVHSAETREGRLYLNNTEVDLRAE